MSECPVTCAMHARAVRWLAAGNVALLREFQPLFDRMAPTTWRACRCRVAARVRDTLEAAREPAL